MKNYFNRPFNPLRSAQFHLLIKFIEGNPWLSFLFRRWGYLLLILSFFLGALISYWGDFDDEADNWVIGREIARGQVLYRDVFSHHFPFPYYVASGIVRGFGDSFLAQRLSVWIFQLAAFGLSMILTGYDRPLGIAVLIWSWLRRFYRANMFLYNSFSAAGLLVVFVVTFAILMDRRKPDWKHFTAFGFFSAVAILSDPLSVYAVGIAILFLLVKHFKVGLLAGVSTAACLSIYGSYLLISGTFDDFYQAAILFNMNIYNQYSNANPLRLQEIWRNILNGLDIFNKTWHNINPFIGLSIAPYANFDRWIFTGFLYRLGLVALALLLAMHRKFVPAIFVYIISAAILMIFPFDFRAQSFIICALVGIAFIICGEFRSLTLPLPARMVEYAAVGIVSVMLLWLGLRVTLDTMVKIKNISPSNMIQTWREEKYKLIEMACGQQDVYLMFYPGGNYAYWLTDFRPASRYLYMWPWIADVGLEQAMAELKSRDLAIAVLQQGEVWGIYFTEDYLWPLRQLLDSQYIEIEKDHYISPQLNELCKAQGKGIGK